MRQRRIRNAHYILAQSAVPVCLAPNGTVATNGAITLVTALPTTYSGGIWLRLPAGAVSGGSAGLYWAVMSSTTQGQVYTNFVDPASAFTPYIPGTLAAAVGSNSAYTQSTAIITMVNVTIPGGAMGPNGAYRLTWKFNGSGAGSKAQRAKFGDQTPWNPFSVTTSPASGIHSLQNRGSVNRQYSSNGSSGDSGSAGTGVYIALDTSIDQTLALTTQLTTATDAGITEGFMLEILPS